MRTADFDFALPEELIALTPAEPRDAARMLVVTSGAEPPLADRTVRDLPDLLRPGDVLVVNDTRVIPAALEGRRMRGEASAKVALNLLRRLDTGHWRALARPAKRLQPGDTITFGHDLTAEVVARLDEGEVEVRLVAPDGDTDAGLKRAGSMPLPPYIAGRRPADGRDAASYQTVYAARDGAVAAPTAGLHFTPELLSALANRGITRHTVTLHVGAGTFLPVKTEDVSQHRMHAEWCTISPETADALNRARAAGGRIIAVGTTSLRTLESAVGGDGIIRPLTGDTSIFITPGYHFRAVDALMTNFHLPRSTLFMLVAAFAGLDTMRAAYAHAIAARYRFYSYGDASLLWPAERGMRRGEPLRV